MAVPKPALQPHPEPPLPHIRVLPDGTVTLPPEVVRAAGFEGGETLGLRVAPGELRLVPAEERAGLPRKQPLIDLYLAFAPVREEVEESGISEEELFALIDEAVAASRRARPIPPR